MSESAKPNGGGLPPAPVDVDLLEPVVDRLCQEEGAAKATLRNPYYHLVPNREVLADVVERLRSVFFPGFFGEPEISDASVRFHIGAALDHAARGLQEQIQKALSFECDQDPHGCAECAERAATLTRSFVERLPEVRRLLATDVIAAYEGDPAATGPDEVIICYPGMMAITNHRIAHELYNLEVPLLPRIISELSHSETGIDLHPGATIAERFFIDHGTGVVIGETCEIGRNVRIYQGVTLGAKSFPLDDDGHPIKGIPRHPLVEEDVIIYGGATILGRVTIGKGTVIGGNVWLTESTEPGAKVSVAVTR